MYTKIKKIIEGSMTKEKLIEDKANIFGYYISRKLSFFITGIAKASTSSKASINR